jgi:leucyl-tRNA---protein transferase
MMAPGIYYPESLTAHELDTLLERGCYRMEQGIIAGNHLVMENIFYRVFWLRYRLSAIQWSSNRKKLLKQNHFFVTTVRPLVITGELEQLYALYKTGIDFNPAPSVKEWLLKEGAVNIFESLLMEVRHEGRLIAAGVFDNGSMSMAGIMSFYHPDYKKYSLGKYLLLKKIEYARAQGKQWFYPGYIVAGISSFDYKLFPCEAATEMLIPERDEWVAYNAALVKELE